MFCGLLRSLGASFVAIVCLGTIGGSICAQTPRSGIVDLTFPKYAAPRSPVIVPTSLPLPSSPPTAQDEKSTPAFPPVEQGSASMGNSLPSNAFPPVDLPPKYTTFTMPLDKTASATAPTETSPAASEGQPSKEGGQPDEAQPNETVPVVVVPTLTEPYWVKEVQQRAAAAERATVALGYEQAIWDALAHSPYVKGVQLIPQINEAKIMEANGVFDPTPFVDSIFNDTSDPVGSTLTTGGPRRLNERRLDNGVGLRGKNQLGGTTELSQNMTMRDNNSVFLAPKQQADTKLLLKMNQPLMRGAGRTYATSSVRIAELNVGISQHEATRKLQLHAQQIASAYWNLYAARSVELQSERGKQRLTGLHEELLKRAAVDGLESQLKRAEAAVARQTSNIARAQADVIAASANLRALVNSPDMSGADIAMIPVTSPLDEPFQVDRVQELEVALAYHPDLLAARDRIKSATIRLKVAENELRPTLNLVMEGYLRGLNGDYDLGNSVADQFSQGRPAYSGGLSYQRPYRNLISNSILRERRLEMRQLLFDLDNTMLVVTADVDQAMASVKATYAELESAVKSTLAFDEEVRYLDARWRNAFVESTGPSLLLDELLNAQNQLIQAENTWARAQAEHMIAFAKLHVATGALLNSMKIGE